MDLPGLWYYELIHQDASGVVDIYADRIKICHSLVTDEAVKESLKKQKGCNAQLTSWRIEEFTKKGDNYVAMVTSVIVQYTLDGQAETTSFIAKINPYYEMPQFQTVTPVLFQKEVEFYMKLLPQLNAVLETEGFKALSFPQSYYGNVQKGKELILLEDLRPRGFKMFNRRKGMDVPHTTLVVKELARLHAASLLLQKKNPEYHKNTLLHRGWYNFTDERKPMPLIRSQLDNGIAMLKKAGGYETSQTFLENIKENLEDLLKKQMEPSKYQVLCHGDSWINNLLFRYNEDGFPEEVMFVDLQICRWESFAIDLNHTFFTSITGEVRKANLEAFLESYRQQYNTILETGGVGGSLTATEVMDEYRSKNIIGCVFLNLVISAVLMEPEVVLQSNKREEDNSFIKNVKGFNEKMMEMMDSNPIVKTRFLAVFDELIETGLIPKC